MERKLVKEVGGSGTRMLVCDMQGFTVRGYDEVTTVDAHALIVLHATN